MLDYVVNALEGAREIAKVAIVGPKKDLDDIYGDSPGIVTVESGKTIIDSLQKGIEAAKKAGLSAKVLVVTSDIPLITGEIIDDFIKQCQTAEEADIIYPIVSKVHNDEKFPGVKRTYVKLKDGIFTGGNIFLINPHIVARCAKIAERIVGLRKSPLKLIHFIGMGYIFKYFLGTLSIADAEARVSQILDIKAKSLIVSHPEIGVDVDKPSDLELVKEILIHSN